MGEPLSLGGLGAVGAPGAPSIPSTPDSPAGQALALYARVLASRTLVAAAHALVAALVADFGVGRAFIGLRERGRTGLMASSVHDRTQGAGDSYERVIGAMDEAIDQATSLAWPLPAGCARADDPITVELQALQRGRGTAVAAVPLGGDGEPFGALVVERASGVPFGAAELARLEQVTALAAPALRWMHRAEQPLRQRAWRELAHAAAQLRRPDRRLRRHLLAAAGLALAALALVPLPREVGGRARIEGAEQRVLAAPTEGFVKTSHVRPGDRVLAGAALVDLIDDDLRLERERWSSQLTQHENAYAAAMARADRVGAATSMARVLEAQSQLALVGERLARGRIVAPFDALVIDGDLSQSIGAPVRQGDTLLTLATTGHQRVIIDVDEVDIARVQPGQPGRLALSALPWQGEDLVVERVTPMARARDGRNVFEVEARLVSPSAELRPGLLGRAELVVGQAPPLWGWVGHALQRMRVTWWSWLG